MTSEELRGIGARLRAAREKKGLTVLQAAERLHVDARVLEALESEDFSVLGAPVYVRGHLKRYAELTGESAAELQDLYAGRSPASPPDLTRIARSERPPRSSPLVLPALLGVVAMAIAGLLWWAFNLPGEKAHPVATAPPPAQATNAQPGNGPASAPAAAPATGQGGAAAPVPGAGQPTSSATPVELDLRVAERSWVQVSDAGGQRLLEGMIESGTVRSLTGTAPLRVVLGDSDAVGIVLNGQLVDLDGLVHRNRSAHLLIDAAGHATLAPARLAHGD
jgi:cytoskeleton protein RodZ